MGDEQQRVIEFWFGTSGSEAERAEAKSALWWSGKPETDEDIRARFADLHARAVSGQLEDWAETAKGRLALIIVLDQFSRNLHRGTADAFACDARAVALVLEGVGRGHDTELSTIERHFFYMPLMHSEELAEQDRGIELFAANLESAEPALRESCESFLDFAHRHRDIVARFGRFPHRNETLGRTSTNEELAFLEQPGSSF